MKEVIAKLTVKLKLKTNDVIALPEVINELNYSFEETTGKAIIEDTEITDYVVLDSKEIRR